jgi:SAM-dependent methyltransferase
MRVDSFPYAMLCHVAGGRRTGPLQILDVGCGTGAALVPMAKGHPGCSFVGVDLSPAPLRIVEREAQRAGLENLELRCADLSQEETWAALRERAPSGYDVVYFSGVLHHLAAPKVALQGLARVLAPRGVISLMVYGRYGREPIERLAATVQALLPGEPGDGARLAQMTELLAELERLGAIPAGTADLPQAELADRYLHPLARSYTVGELDAELAEAGLRRMRWLEPRDWQASHCLGDSDLSRALDAAPEHLSYAVLERLAPRPRLELTVGHLDAAPAQTPQGDALVNATVERNPQCAWVVQERSYRGQGWVEKTELRVRNRAPEPLGGPARELFVACAEPIAAAELVETVASRGANVARLWEALAELLRREALIAW